MKQVPLGSTGLMVSEVGFGGIPLTRVSEEEAVGLLRAAVDKGFTYFDTARMYGDSEIKMGRAFEGIRERVILATKTMKRGGQEMTQEIEASLERLRTSYIDLYQMHNLVKPEGHRGALRPGRGLSGPAAGQARRQGGPHRLFLPPPRHGHQGHRDRAVRHGAVRLQLRGGSGRREGVRGGQASRAWAAWP